MMTIFSSHSRKFIMKVFIKSFFPITLILLNVVAFSQGSTYTWIGGANPASWTVSTNWSPSRTSALSSDVLVFNSNAEVSFNTTSVTIGKLQITNGASVILTNTANQSRILTVSAASSDAILVSSGSTLTLRGNSSNSNRTLTLTTTNTTDLKVDIYGTVIADNSNGTNGILTKGGSSAEIIFRSGSIYDHKIDGVSIPSATWNSGSTLNVTGASNSLPGGTYHHVTLNNNSTLTVTGDVTLNGDMTLTSGTFIQTNNSTLKTVTIYGDLLLGGGTYNFSTATTIISTNPVLNLYGDLIQTSGKITTTGTATVNGVVNFSNTNVAQNLSFASSFNVSPLPSDFTNYKVNYGVTVRLGSNLGLYSQTNNTYSARVEVESGGVLDFQGFSISESPIRPAVSGTLLAYFELKAGGKMITTSSSGITGAVVPSTYMSATFANSTSYEFNGGNQSTGILPSQVTNITFGGTGTKTFQNTSLLTIDATLSIGSDPSIFVAIPSGLTYNASQFVIAGQAQTVSAFWGGASAPFTGSSANWTHTVGTSKYKAFKTERLLGTGILQVGAAALPVTLSNFTARATTDNKVNLSWVTAAESVNKGFRIERQSEGENKFSALGFIPSKAEGGNSQTTIAYSFRDVTAKMGTNTYRLVQEDLDGKLTYTEVRVVKLNGQSVSMVFPNPSNGAVNISRTADGKKMNIQVIDQSGRIISQVNNITDANYRMNISQSGIYSIKLMYPETGEQSIQRIVVQH
jgi:hypothetical protein